MFRFKQFHINHDRCAMKVGTDGVLLGAWAPLPQKGIGLDIGTGSGLIALMAAQRAPDMTFIGIDVDAEAIAQAHENVMESPFSDRVSVNCCSLQDFLYPKPFDAILCNPPFFEESLLPPDPRRSMARHTSQLPFADLAKSASSMLSAEGFFSVILPASATDTFTRLCQDEGLQPCRQCYVHTTARKAPKRILSCYSHQPSSLHTESLVLQDGDARSEEYSQLCEQFYL